MYPPTHVHRNMFNEFPDTRGKKSVNFRNADSERTSTTSIEIHNNEGPISEVVVKTEDNVPMALSLLGVGRVTEEVETIAQHAMEGKTEEELLRFAVINLRAITLLREKKEAETAKELDEAYALYMLAYPKGTGRVEFESTGLKDHWLSVLRNVRKDPTKLGAL